MEKILTDIGKSIQFIAIISLTAFTLVACQNSETGSMKNNISSKVIQSILDHHEIQPYLHPDLKNRLPIRVVSNRLISTEISIKKFDQPVLFLQEKPTEPHFEIITLKQAENSMEFAIRYDVEGVSISGQATVEGDQINFSVFDVVES